MPKIDFTFTGWVRGALITEAADTEGNKVDVSQMPPTELEQKLSAGDLTISLGTHLYESDKADIEMTDFEATPCWPDEA